MKPSVSENASRLWQSVAWSATSIVTVFSPGCTPSQPQNRLMGTIETVENDKARFPQFQQFPQPLRLNPRLRLNSKPRPSRQDIASKDRPPVPLRKKLQRNSCFYLWRPLGGDYSGCTRNNRLCNRLAPVGFWICPWRSRNPSSGAVETGVKLE